MLQKFLCPFECESSGRMCFFSYLGTLPYIFYEEAAFIEVSVSLKSTQLVQKL